MWPDCKEMLGFHKNYYFREVTDFVDDKKKIIDKKSTILINYFCSRHRRLQVNT